MILTAGPVPQKIKMPDVSVSKLDSKCYYIHMIPQRSPEQHSRKIGSRSSQPQEPISSSAQRPKPRFALGQLIATPGVLEALNGAGDNPADYLSRHVSGDWGDLENGDRQENELSVTKGFRILSAYRLSDNTRIWIITEADRSATTILLPEEY
jgi:hypothetical protein